MSPRRFPILLLLMAFACPSQANQTESAFESGVAAFQAGEFDRARTFLEQARDQGVTSSALHYNLGVVYFRLDQYSNAETEFRQLLDTPHAPLARYNLGLVLQASGDEAAAQAWFARAADPSSPEQIRLLAERQLEPEALPASTPVAQERNLLFVSVAAGYDDNIAGTPSGAATEEQGVFGEALASGRLYLNQHRGQAIRLEAAAYSRQYPGSARYDDTYARVGAAWQQPVDAGRVLAGLAVSGLWFGGDLLEQQTRLELEYQRPGCFWPQVVLLDCAMEGFVAKVAGGSGYEAYDGELYGGVFRVDKDLGQWRLDAAYRLTVEQRDDLQAGAELYSLSPTRHRLSVGAERQITNSVSLGLEQAVGLSRYDDPHRLQQNGNVQTRRREDDQFRTRLFAGKQLDARWRLGMEVSWVDNQSTLPRYDYQRGVILVSLDGVF